MKKKLNNPNISNTILWAAAILSAAILDASQFLTIIILPICGILSIINVKRCQTNEQITPSLHIDEESGPAEEEALALFIKNSSIGEMNMDDLEREAIERTLKLFKNNRRATAKSLGMNERTLYRKIDQYGLERTTK